MSSMELADVEEEIPLEIEDYSCNTLFEEVVKEMEQYIIMEFRTHPELQRFALTTNAVGEGKTRCTRGTDNDDDNREMVLGRRFTINRRSAREAWSDNDGEEIMVEIHVHNFEQQQQQQHPIVRLFAVPVFFLVRNTATSLHHSYSESSFYLSLLVCAVSRAMRVSFSLYFERDPLSLTSPFYYANGTVPCFVAVGDPSQLTFMGVAPPALVDAFTSNGGAALDTTHATLHQLFVHLVVKCRFCCTAYPSTPDCCRRVIDCLDVFQLHLGKQSRVRRDTFEGICVSLQRKFKLMPPRRFSMNPALPRITSSDIRHGELALSWGAALDNENDNILPSTMRTTFPFGTGTAPLRGIYFTFQWNQLRDTEARDDGARASNLNPFTPEAKYMLEDKLNITAVAIPKDESDLNHASCKYLSKYYETVMQYISQGSGSENSPNITDDIIGLADDIMDRCGGMWKDRNSPVSPLAMFPACKGEFKSDVRNVYYPGSLLCRFACACARDVHDIDGVRALWKVIVQRLKALLDDSEDRKGSLQKLIATIGIPAVDEINHGMPLIIQKMQLLVICSRRMLEKNATVPADQPAQDEWGSANEQGSPKLDGSQDGVEDVIHRSNDSEFYGRCTKRVKRLITNGEVLVEPQPLPVPPYTTDILLAKSQEERDPHSHSASSSQHSPSLVLNEGLFNDMCLFLYVNRSHEGRVVRFADFVHWYSPRDFVSPPHSPATGTTETGGPTKPDFEVDINDSAYLSERMQRREDNTWWLLWEQAAPRSPEEIIEQLFVPEEQAHDVVNWMESELQLDMLLLETVQANFSNALHPLLSHRHVETNEAIAAYVMQKSEEVTSSIKDLFYSDPLFSNVETLRTTYSTAIRRVEEIETSVCVAIAIERTLCTLDVNCQMLTSPVTRGAVTEEADHEALREFIAALSSPQVPKNSDSALTSLRLRTGSLRWDVWHRCRVFERFSEDERSPISTYLRATCMAERPLNTTPCFQQMIAETDEGGTFRVALTLAEEVL
ncbi:hypothetical protein, conserved [Trypanosoma brucei brucei TREU927]|uniref:Rab3 GTPase-activating protein catalytic subunit n=1 Tax=Trypanosoma brucei brucei (strain 927/4 GUTat10.1) TaxID=185431 RepID=Q57XY8_TRYB2|nr:hypothetical protein, conserved [Trypanosoma brucei brucei TREU927]AAX69531.1 hypothetical protein, conserved [Trypanosoma brucei]AAZ10190.1 hypothetical protein, conserved [Trypanosoma brucei brucei TREU927]